MNVEALIAKRLAAPKSFKVVTTYADGSISEHLTETRRQADTNCAFASGAIGRKATNPATGSVSKVVSVAVSAL